MLGKRGQMYKLLLAPLRFLWLKLNLEKNVELLVDEDIAVANSAVHILVMQAQAD